jgi:hypothetical protein
MPESPASTAITPCFEANERRRKEIPDVCKRISTLIEAIRCTRQHACQIEEGRWGYSGNKDAPILATAADLEHVLHRNYRIRWYPASKIDVRNTLKRALDFETRATRTRKDILRWRNVVEFSAYNEKCLSHYNYLK